MGLGSGMVLDFVVILIGSLDGKPASGAGFSVLHN
jgi:hypothetical protein